MRRTRACAVLAAAMLSVGIMSDLPAESFTEEQAVDRALAASRDLAYQNALLSAQELTYSLGIREYFPSFSVGYDENDTVTMGAPDSWSRTISLSATQPLFRGGIKPYERRVARLDLATAREDMRQKYRALEYELRSQFSGILVAQRKREILLRTIELAQQNIAILQTQVRVGEALDLDLAQAELEMLSLQITLSQTESALEDARYQIRKSLSMDPSAPLDLTGRLDPSLPALDLAGLDEDLYTRVAGYSVDLKKQGAAVQKAAIQVSAASFPFVPDVDLEVSAAFTGDQFPLRVPRYAGKLTFSFPVPEAPTTYSAGASLTPGRDRGGSLSVSTSPAQSITAWVDRKTAALTLDAENRRKEEIAQDLRFQVTRMIAAYSQAARTRDLAARKLDVQRRKETILKRQMDLGEVKRIDYLQGAIETANAEIALDEAALRLVQGERDWENLLGVPAGGLRAIVTSERSADK